MRAQFLDQACAGDARLRAAVEEMLLANDAAENFFEQVPFGGGRSKTGRAGGWRAQGNGD